MGESAPPRVAQEGGEGSVVPAKSEGGRSLHPKGVCVWYKHNKGAQGHLQGLRDCALRVDGFISFNFSKSTPGNTLRIPYYGGRKIKVIKTPVPARTTPV